MMKNLRVFWFIQLCGALVLLLVSMITLLQSAQRNTDNITLLHQQVIKQLSNQFSGDDYKMLVQQIRNSLNPQQLLSYLNGIPQTRRQRMSVTDGIRSWMASRWPDFQKSCSPS